MKFLVLVTALALALIGTLLLGEKRSETSESVQSELEARRYRLTRGVNLSHWFAQAPADPEHLRSYITDQDAASLGRFGFRHVRLSVDPDLLLDAAQPNSLNPEMLAHLDQAIKMMLDRDIAVVIDVHPEQDFKDRLARDDRFVAAVADFWRAAAQHFSATDPDRVFLEVLNEPNFHDPERWAWVQTRLLSAMREGAPMHTLIATGYAASTAEELTDMLPVADRNVVYNFHFYEPFAFTHQGATWGQAEHASLRDLPYPSSPELLAPILPRIREPGARNLARQYGDERWGRAELEVILSDVAAWGKRHQVHLICNEFGVYRPYAPAESRVIWIRDVRQLLEQNKIGWTLWDYAAGFGLVTDEAGKRVIDSGIVSALGLPE